MEIPLDSGEHPVLDGVYRYWNMKRGKTSAPRRADIDPLEFHLFLPYVCLLDVTLEPLEFRYRLCGTAVCNLLGMDPTGKPLDILTPLVFKNMVYENYAQSVRECRAIQHRVHFFEGGENQTYSRLTLPIVDVDGDVKMLMTVGNFDQCDPYDFHESFREMSRSE